MSEWEKVLMKNAEKYAKFHVEMVASQQKVMEALIFGTDEINPNLPGSVIGWELSVKIPPKQEELLW